MNQDADFFTDSNGQKWIKDHFIYTVSALNIPSDGLQSSVLNIESDSRFVWEKTSYNLRGGACFAIGFLPFVDIKVSFIDTTSGRQLQLQPQIVSEIAGINGLPQVLPQPRMLLENSSILVNFRNNELTGPFAVSPLSVFLSLHGYKLFRA